MLLRALRQVSFSESETASEPATSLPNR